MHNLKVLFEDNHIIVVEKEPNIPVQEDESGDRDMLTIIKDYLKEKYNKPGNVFVGLVHRLDRPVGGVMVFAKTSKAASRLSEEIRSSKFSKKYLTLVHGKLDNTTGRLEDYLLKDESTNTSRIVDEKTKDAKKATLEYKVLNYDKDKNLSLVEVNLLTGRHHQIRTQFAGIKHPLYGDQRYGNLKEVGIQIHLWAEELTFKHPVKDEIMTFKSEPRWKKR